MDAFHYEVRKSLHELYEVVTSLQAQIDELKEKLETFQTPEHQTNRT